MKKKSIFFLLVVAALFNFESNGHRRYYHGGYGGWGWSPAWGYGWGGPSVTFAVGGRPVRRTNRDDMGRTYWSVINGSDTSLLVRASQDDYQEIAPGEKQNVQRRGSFSIVVKSPDGQRRKFQTRNHFIELSRNSSGRIIYNSWNE